ncbi:MAG: hypothetical protein ACRDMV_25220 [Streptosporangiales bacterium]
MSDDTWNNSDEAADDFLMSGGTPSAKFKELGANAAGRIARRPEVQQQRDFDSGEPLYWDDGSPRKQIKVILRTDQRDPEIEDDTGERALYIKGNLLRAVRAAVKKSGAKGLAVEGWLSVTYTFDGEAKKKGLNPPKLYSAEYLPPDEAAANQVLDGDSSSAPEQPAAQQASSSGPDFSQFTPEQVAAFLQAQQQKAS